MGALTHRYLEQLHDAEDEPVANFQFDMSFEQEFKDNTLKLDRTKAVLERELEWFNEFQLQRTRYLLQVKSNKTSSSSTMASSRSGSNQSMQSVCSESQRVDEYQKHILQ